MTPWSEPTALIFPPADLHRGFKNGIVEKSPTTFDQYIRHDIALRRLVDK